MQLSKPECGVLQKGNWIEVRVSPFTLAGIALLLLWSSCSDESCGKSTTGMTLRVVDSLGVEIGDSTQMFGDINGVCFLSDSVFVVFDRSCQNLRSYTTDGSHLRTESYIGAGPLEYLFVEYMSPFDSGFGLFEFEMPPRCVFFDSEGAPVGSVTLDESTSLVNPVFLGRDHIVGSVGSIHEENGSPEMKFETCIWNSDSGSREMVIHSVSRDLGTVQEAYGRYVELEHCIATWSDSLIFIAPDLDEYGILSFTADGVCRDTMTFEHTRELRSGAEIELELIWRKLRDGNLGDWQPSELEPGITQLQVQDSSGLLWVCHGSLFSPKFEVFTASGEHAFRCGVSGLPETDFYRFCISDHGYIAYTMYPADYPRVYILELVGENETDGTGAERNNR